MKSGKGVIVYVAAFQENGEALFGLKSKYVLIIQALEKEKKKFVT